MTYNNHDDASYCGNFENNDLSGYGMFRSRSKTYEGDFLNNKRHGKGTLVDPLGKFVYHGDWKNGK